MRKPSLKPVLLVLGLCALLPACSLLGNKPQASMHIYTLEAGAVAAAAAGTAATNTAARPANAAAQPVLLVEVPSAAAGYDSNRMVYLRQPQTLEAFTQSNWVDTPARMLAPLLVQTLQRSARFKAVLLAPSAAKAGLRLDTEIVRLQQNFLQTPSSVRFTLQATLSDNLTHEVLAWKALDAVQPASSEDAAGGSAAASAAVQQVMQELTRWVQASAP